MTGDRFDDIWFPQFKKKKKENPPASPFIWGLQRVKDLECRHIWCCIDIMYFVIENRTFQVKYQ